MGLTKLDLANAVEGIAAASNGGTGVSTGVVANSMIDVFTFNNAATAVQHNNGELLSGFVRDTTSGVGTLNPGMAFTSDLWVFPSTGLYKVSYNLNVFSEGNEHNISVFMNFTADNGSNFVEHCRDMTAVDSGNASETMRGTWYLNITDTSNDKFKWSLGLNRATKFRTGTSATGSRFYFVKLA